MLHSTDHTFSPIIKTDVIHDFYNILNILTRKPADMFQHTVVVSFLYLLFVIVCFCFFIFLQ